MKNVLGLVFILVLYSCSSSGSEETTHGNSGDSSVSKKASDLTVTTSSGKSIIISETHPNGMSLSNLKIYSSSIADSVVAVDVDPVSSVLTGDLDADGYQEIYVITTAAGSGSYGNIVGAVIMGDSILVPVAFPAFDPGVKTFEGYMGSDSFYVEGNMLMRSFPVYKKADVNSTTTGEKMLVGYRLMKKGNKFLLLEAKN
jgi:hypothetical protein